MLFRDESFFVPKKKRFLLMMFLRLFIGMNIHDYIAIIFPDEAFFDAYFVMTKRNAQNIIWPKYNRCHSNWRIMNYEMHQISSPLQLCIFHSYKLTASFFLTHYAQHLTVYGMAKAFNIALGQKKIARIRLKYCCAFNSVSFSEHWTSFKIKSF